MPELPEVEVTRQAVKKFLVNRSIASFTIRQPRLRWPVPSLLKKLGGLQIQSISRRAKYLCIDTEQGTLIIHLGMSGRLKLLDSQTAPEKHDHVDIVLDNKQVIRYNDPRRFGAVLWTTTALNEHKLLSHLGPEPLEKDFNADYLFKSLSKRKTTIKQFIMDQKIVVGVGNIYANEALFISKILPQRAAHTLSIVECTLLVSTIKTVLKTAIKHGGTTLRDFLSPEGKTGYFVQKLLVYGREDQACFDCNTTLSALRLGNRAAVYCSSCQK